MDKPNRGPGRSNRRGISKVRLADMILDEAAAVPLFEAVVWPDGRTRPRGESVGKYKASSYRCRTVGKTFGVRTDMADESNRLPLKKWVWARYLEMTSHKGV